jgi:hypothetical protein
MPDITTESEAVAALEAAVPLGSWPHMVSAETDPIIRADRWLAWLVRNHVGVDRANAGIDCSQPFRALLHGATMSEVKLDPSPLVAAARAFLENRNG